MSVDNRPRSARLVTDITRIGPVIDQGKERTMATFVRGTRVSRPFRLRA